MLILLSNDDGVHARGLEIMHKFLMKIGKVCVVAPAQERSTTSHSLTIHKPLRINRLENGFYDVNGTPADCVYLGIREILRKKPDLVISGINRGANLGQDVYYSGTVSAAREACMLGIPAIAVSMDVDYRKGKTEKEIHFDTAAKVILRLIKRVDVGGLPEHTLLNVNVPDVPMKQVKGFAGARQGFRYYTGSVIRRVDHRGKPYFWIGGQYTGFHDNPGTDCNFVAKRHVSVTPLKLDSTDTSFLSSLKRFL